MLRQGPSFTSLALVGLLLAAMPVQADGEGDGWWLFDSQSWDWASETADTPYAIAVFGGAGTERNFTDTLENFHSYESSSDSLVAIAASQEIAWFRDQLSIEGEVMYGFHFGREEYHEIGVALYARWHDFPWNDYVLTTFAVGMGPSYTTEFPMLETQDDPTNRSRTLNQFNLELTVAPPDDPSTSVMLRLQHRSGMFGMFGGVSDASNFLTIGLRQEF
jgi:hypothetical protein